MHENNRFKNVHDFFDVDKQKELKIKNAFY